MYSIKSIATLTGLGTETLRAWERRYQTIVPERDENGRRFYSQVDLERLTLLANLTKQGHAISKVSGLQIADLQKMLNSGEQQPENLYVFAEQIVSALQDYRIDRCEMLLKKALMANEPLDYIRDVLSPALSYVGQLWHDGKLSIAQEHMFSACVKRILLSMVNNLHSISANRPGIVFATPTGEPHEFGLLMCCLLAAEQQYNCYYLGASLPAADIIDATSKLKAQIIVLSLLKTPLEKPIEAELQTIVDKVNPEKVRIWLGGKGSEHWHDQQEAIPTNVELIEDFDGFYVKAQQRRYLND